MKRKPDYRAKAIDKLTDKKGTIGAAWSNADGSISLVLDPFISLHSDVIITLFPENKQEK